MLERARRLNEADFDYMDTRIRYETAGDYGIDAFKD
jgi:hypothetical protein